MKHLVLITALIVLPAIAVLTILSTHAFAQPTTAAASRQSLNGSASPQPLTGTASPQPAAAPAAASPQPHPALAITHLTGDCYVYTTYGLSDGQPYPANSMYLVTGHLDWSGNQSLVHTDSLLTVYAATH